MAAACRATGVRSESFRFTRAGRGARERRPRRPRPSGTVTGTAGQLGAPAARARPLRPGPTARPRAPRARPCTKHRRSFEGVGLRTDISKGKAFFRKTAKLADLRPSPPLYRPRPGHFFALRSPLNHLPGLRPDAYSLSSEVSSTGPAALLRPGKTHGGPRPPGASPEAPQAFCRPLGRLLAALFWGQAPATPGCGRPPVKPQPPSGPLCACE